jgi:hypothetical protein
MNPKYMYVCVPSVIGDAPARIVDKSNLLIEYDISYGVFNMCPTFIEHISDTNRFSQVSIFFKKLLSFIT